MPTAKKIPLAPLTRYVLVIEDNSHHAELVTEVLDRHFSPVVIHTVDSPERGLDFASRSRYDLIITAGMIAGIQISKFLPKLVDLSSAAPVIVISGQGDEAYAARLIKQGAAEYLPKTRETLEELHTVLLRHLKARRRTKPSKKAAGSDVEAPPPSSAEIIREVERITREALSFAASKRRRRGRGLDESAQLKRLLSQIKHLRELAHKLVK